MSHLATLDVKILDLTALAEAVAQCGAELALHQTSFRWYQGVSPCAHAIRLPANATTDGTFGWRAKPYEVGVVPAKDGLGYELQYDTYGAGQWIADRFGGQALTKLKDEYGYSVTARALARKGYTAVRQQNALGQLQLLAVKR